MENNKDQPTKKSWVSVSTTETEEVFETDPACVVEIDIANDEQHEKQQQEQEGITKGEIQPAECHDVAFAILFYIQMIIVATLAFVFGLPTLRVDKDTNNKSNDFYTNSPTGTEEEEKESKFNNFLPIIVTSIIISLTLTTITILTMHQYSTILIKFSLIIWIIIAAFVAIISLLTANLIGLFWGVLFVLWSVHYKKVTWRRIPFAASNLNAGLEAVKSSWGVVVLAYGLGLFGSCGYLIVWSLAVMGVFYLDSNDVNVDCEEGDVDCDGGGLFGLYAFLLLLACYWTQKVLQNTIHVTVAGTVGTWWFVPTEASSFWSPAAFDSFKRALTTSFGSICFGSLLVAIVETLKNMVRRAQRRNAILACVLECLLWYIQRVMEYFNHWAYIYVGLYGYSYLESGKNVMTLFQQRGWTTIIIDYLVSRALLLVSLLIGLITSFVCFLLFGTSMSFFVPFVIGFVMSLFPISVIDSAVSTVIVCFAESPAEFQANHPRLYEDMKSTWRTVYPEEFNL